MIQCLILLALFKSKLVSSYPTSFQSTIIPFTQNLPFQTSILCQNLEVVNIVSASTPWGASENWREVDCTYDRPFSGTTQAFSVILELIESQIRHFVDFSVKQRQITSSGMKITYADYGLPVALFHLTIHVLAYDISSIQLIQHFQTYDDHLTYSHNFENIPTTFPVETTVSCYFLTLYKADGSINNNIFNLATRLVVVGGILKIQYWATFPTPNNDPKTVGFVVICVDNRLLDYTSQIFQFSNDSPQNFIISSQNVFIVGFKDFNNLNRIFHFQFTCSPTSIELYGPLIRNYVFRKFEIAYAGYPGTLPRYNFQLTELKTVSVFSPLFILIYQNVPDIGNIDVQQLTITGSHIISVLNVEIEGTTVKVFCSCSQEFKKLKIDVKLKWKMNYYNFQALTQVQYQIGSSPTKTIASVSSILQYIYLIMYMASLLSNKLIGLQVISLIQLVFYCQAPIGINSGLNKMKYVSGYNLIFPALKELNVFVNYSILNIHSNFLSNANIMLLLPVICTLVFGLLFLASKYNKSYKFKPRLKLYAVAFLCQWSFVLMFFSSYNIYISTLINAQIIGKQDILSTFISFFVAMIPVTLLVLYFHFHEHYVEFKSQIKTNETIRNFSYQQSKIICRLYPIILGIQIIIIPLFLGIQPLLNYSLNFILVFNILVTIFIIISMPYLETLNNIRLLINRILSAAAILFSIILNHYFKSDYNSESTTLKIIWCIISILILGILINFPFILWKLILFLQKNGIIDMKMYLKKKKKTNKQMATVPDSQNPGLYPILEYGIGRQRYLDRENGVGNNRIEISNIKSNNIDKNNFIQTQKRRIQQQLRQQRLN